MQQLNHGIQQQVRQLVPAIRDKQKKGSSSEHCKGALRRGSNSSPKVCFLGNEFRQAPAAATPAVAAVTTTPAATTAANAATALAGNALGGKGAQQRHNQE